MLDGERPAHGARSRRTRVDAVRNYAHLVEAARDAFAEKGADVPMDDIATRAQVSRGTLYRHFPTREALIEAVYRTAFTNLTESAYELLDQFPPDEALTEWLRNQVEFVIHINGFATAMRGVIDRHSEAFSHYWTAMTEATAAVIDRAQKAGALDNAVTPDELIRLTYGIGTATATAPEMTDRFITLALNGLRPRE